MKITIIGAGNVGGTLGARWEAAGHEVVYGLREPAKKEGARSIADALNACEVLLLAIPGADVVDFVRQHTRSLDGKVIIDATNNFSGPAINSWAEIAPLLPKAQLYRAFNSYGWDVYANPTIGGAQPDLFYAGPDGPRQADVEELITAAGLHPVRVGSADQAGTVDGVLRLWFTLSQSHGRHIALKLITD